jgi:hypothetical protein
MPNPPFYLTFNYTGNNNEVFKSIPKNSKFAKQFGK